jgi:hypothetical protein
VIAAIEPTVFIVVAVFVLTILGVAYGLKTRKGSGINEHPGPDQSEPVPRGEPADPDHQEDSVLDQHGKK